MGRRAIWDLGLLLAGILYLAAVLCLQVESPALGLGFVLLAAYELIESRRRGHNRGRL